jgi:RNA polymerase sigma-70 factor (ECF subfamily)
MGRPGLADSHALCPFDEIGPIVNRSPDAARQLASRDRRRVKGAPATRSLDQTRQREVIDAFLAASRDGNLGALLALLDPDVILRADETARRLIALLDAGPPADQRPAHGDETVHEGRERAVRRSHLELAIRLTCNRRNPQVVAGGKHE